MQRSFNVTTLIKLYNEKVKSRPALTDSIFTPGVERQANISQFEGSLSLLPTCRGNTNVIKNDLHSPHKLWWKMNPTTMLNHYSKRLFLTVTICSIHVCKERRWTHQVRQSRHREAWAWRKELSLGGQGEKHQVQSREPTPILILPGGQQVWVPNNRPHAPFRKQFPLKVKTDIYLLNPPHSLESSDSSSCLSTRQALKSTLYQSKQQDTEI